MQKGAVGHPGAIQKGEIKGETGVKGRERKLQKKPLITDSIPGIADEKTFSALSRGRDLGASGASLSRRRSEAEKRRQTNQVPVKYELGGSRDQRAL